MNQEKLAKLNVVGEGEGAERRLDIGGFPSKDYLCQKCGKGFGSMKAVHGHMRVHSKRSRVLPEESRPVLKKRSTMGLKIASAAPSSSSTWNKSEPVASEFDEVEEAAACLMMLSQGGRSCNGEVSFESETLTPCNEEKKTVVVNNDDGKRTESEVLVERFIRAEQFKKVNVKMGCQFSESGLQKVEVCMHRDDDNKALGGQKRIHCPGFMKSKVKKECVNASPLELGSNTEDVIALANSTGGKYKAHECSVCFKIFESGRALGGHMRAHYTAGFMKSKVKKENLAEFLDPP